MKKLPKLPEGIFQKTHLESIGTDIDFVENLAINLVNEYLKLKVSNTRNIINQILTNILIEKDGWETLQDPSTCELIFYQKLNEKDLLEEDNNKDNNHTKISAHPQAKEKSTLLDKLGLPPGKFEEIHSLIKQDSGSSIFLKELPKALVQAGCKIEEREILTQLIMIYADALDETKRIKGGITALSDIAKCKRKLYEKIKKLNEIN